MSFNPATGEVDDGVSAEEAAAIEAHPRFQSVMEAYASIKTDLELAEKDLRMERREVKRLKGELQKQLEQAPEHQLMQTIYQAWINATGRSPKQSKFGPARMAAVLARIREGHSFERLIRAASIGVKGANVSNKEAERLALIAVMKRAVEMVSEADAKELRKLYKATLGRGAKVYDDLELIFRNEVNLERFADMADVIEPLDAEHSIDAGEREGAAF